MKTDFFNRFIGKFKVQTRFIVLLLFVSYISIFIVSMILYSVATKTLDDQIKDTLDTVTATVMENTDKLIYQRYNDMQILITNSVLSDEESSLDDKKRILDSQLVKLGWFDNLHILDPDGVVITSTNRSSIGVNVNEKAWLQEVKDNFIFVSDYIQSPFSGKETLIYGNTLADEDNQVFGYVIAEFSWKTVRDVLRKSPSDLDVILFNGEGEVIATNFDESVKDEKIQDLNNDNYLSSEITSEGYLSYKGNNWKIMARVPTSIAYAPITEFTRILLITAVIISMLVFMLGHFSASQFVKPIFRLTTGVAKVGKGDLTQKIELDTQDEFGFLASHFNEMTSSLLENTNKIIEEKGKYKSILESSNEGIVLIGLTNKVIAFNKTFCKLFGLKEKNLLDSNIKKAFIFLNDPNEDKIFKKNIKKIQKIIGDGDMKKEIDLEITITKPHYKVIKLYSKPVVTEKNSTSGRIWVFNDVTDEREAEKSKNDFISVASHKLRTPLTALNWSLEMLGNKDVGELNELQAKVIDEMSGHTDKLTALVKLLMNTADIKNDRIDTRSEDFHIVNMIEEQFHKRWERMAQTNTNVNAILDIKKKFESVKVRADKDKVLQVMNILFHNSFLYCDAEHKNNISVSIDTLNEKKIIVCFSDTGIGIPEEDYSKIFTKFFRGKEALLKYTDGTGLNLYIAKVIMLSLKEKIWFESEEGKGTKFYFTLSIAP